MPMHYPLSTQAITFFGRLEAAARAHFAQHSPERFDDLFFLRLERHFQDLYDGLFAVYGHRADFGAFIERLAVIMAGRRIDCPDDIRKLGWERMIWPDWFQHQRMLGYIAYADRFAESLREIEAHLDYLAELGVTYLHLMPFLQPRRGENDGGYAVADFRRIDRKLGNIIDLERLTRSLRRRGISLVADLVINHVADDHEWAVCARDGDPGYQEYFYTYPDRALPDQYERALPEVFPATAPGNFTFSPEMNRWVWTTFHEYQWDLNWANPEIFLEVTDIVLYLANLGIEVFRLDAIAFIWKRMGTDCQNQPEVHSLTQALRAMARIAAPTVIFKAEAIVGPQQLMPYLGTGWHHGKVSDLAYHNSLMVQYWSSLAAGDTRLMTRALSRFPSKPAPTAWVTYVRCHDDIGWAIDDEDAVAVGWNGFLHRRFLSDFFSGSFPGSFAGGAVFQENPLTGDRRISGSTASLAGLETASDNPDAISLAIERILLGHALIFGFAGIPLIYMGDEIGLLNDYSYGDDPEHAADNRWMHRPRMDWDKAERRKIKGSVESRIFNGLRRLGEARRQTPQFQGAVPLTILDADSPRIFSYVRIHPIGNLVAIYNFSRTEERYSEHLLTVQGINQPHDLITGHRLEAAARWIRLAPYDRLWVVQERS
jgi:amylosucrase